MEQKCKSSAVMMLNDIVDLAATGESETLEFKETTGRRRSAARTVCAFLNQNGGQVLFGVKRNGDVVGQHVSESTIEDLSTEFQQIDPPAYPKIKRVRVGGNHEMIVVSTDSGMSKPYTYSGKAYLRVGNTTLPMSSDEYNKMLFERMHSEQRWENQPATGWSIDDLDMTEIRRTILDAAQQNRLAMPSSLEPLNILRGLGLLRDGILLRAAVVLFGNNERIEFEMPQCLLRVARFRGCDQVEFLDNRQFYGNAFTLLANAERFMREMLPVAGHFEQNSFERIDKPYYPFLAIREALANAFCHRDYSVGGGSVGIAIYDDRLEVTSSGSLHFGMTPEILFAPHDSRPWNPIIARVFYLRKIIEQWGRGTIRMAEMASESGLPPLEIEDRGMCVTVRFRHGKLVPKQHNLIEPIELRRKVLALLDGTNDGLARREILSQTGADVSDRQVRRVLKELKDKDLIVSVGYGRGAYWRSKQADGVP